LAVINKISNMKKFPSIYYYLTILIIITASCETKKRKN